LAIIASRLARAVALAAAATGAAAAIVYARADLTLTHYDAKGHLVVARRILDSLTPGWQQIGAVWLPLPHLLNALPVQIDASYRSGFSAVAISIASYGVLVTTAARLVLRATGSAAAAIAAAAILGLNPNVLYLQSTPMTEPLLLALLLVSIDRLARWIDAPSPSRRRQAGLALAAACWTRYEAWPVTAAALALAAIARLGRGVRPLDAARDSLRLALWPLAAFAVFVVLSRVTIGEWFVSSGFFVAENPALGRPLVAALQVREGAMTLGGRLLVWTGAAGALATAAAIVRRYNDRRLQDAGTPALVLMLAPLAAAALPWYAFVHGHPYRVRYMVTLVAAAGLLAATLVGLLRRLGPAAPALAASVLVAASVWECPPLDPDAAMVGEAQWDVAHSRARAAVTAYLTREWDGQSIMASMASLAHFMQETSHAGFEIKDYLHEGNGDLWKEALKRPRPHAAWILMEERAEGGDLLAQRAKRDPAFLAGYRRVAEGGGVALYRRD
jgi:hypothetical protein